LNQGVALSVENVFDFNRDALVDAIDQIIARNNQGFMIAINIGGAPALPGPLGEAAPANATSGESPLADVLAMGVSLAAPSDAPAAPSDAPAAPAESVTPTKVAASGVVARYLELIDAARPRRSGAPVVDAVTDAVDSLLDDLPALRRRE
jgi:hypothetical protein